MYKLLLLIWLNLFQQCLLWLFVYTHLYFFSSFIGQDLVLGSKSWLSVLDIPMCTKYFFSGYLDLKFLAWALWFTGDATPPRQLRGQLYKCDDRSELRKRHTPTMVKKYDIVTCSNSYSYFKCLDICILLLDGYDLY